MYFYSPLSLSQENRTRACNNNKNDEYLNEIKSSTREREREGKKRNNVNIEIEIHSVLSVMVTLMLKITHRIKTRSFLLSLTSLNYLKIYIFYFNSIPKYLTNKNKTKPTCLLLNCSNKN